MGNDAYIGFETAKLLKQNGFNEKWLQNKEIN
jgi:hypothetical protein